MSYAIRGAIEFPMFTGVRCLMMPYIQGDPSSVPDEYAPYRQILADIAIEPGKRGYLTIDESPVVSGQPHRGARAQHGRALHTEAGLDRSQYRWGGGGTTWGGNPKVTLKRTTRILLANNIDHTCAVWNSEHPETSRDGDIGDQAARYPYATAHLMKAGEVCEIGILTPHESLPILCGGRRQFLRIVGSGVVGREPYFTENPRLP